MGKISDERSLKDYCEGLNDDVRLMRLPGDEVLVRGADGRLAIDRVATVLPGFAVQLECGKVFNATGTLAGSKPLNQPVQFSIGVDLMFAPVTDEMRGDVVAQGVVDYLRSKEFTDNSMTERHLLAIEYALTH